MIGLADGVTTAWPLLVTIACAVVIDRRREHRRRVTLNRALHELRRPLQALVLASSLPSGPLPGAPAVHGQLAAALAALADLDAEINGGRSAERRSFLRADELVADAVERWRSPAARLGRQLELRWRAGTAVVVGEQAALSRALDNLVANSLEHGAERIRVEGSTTGGRLRILVVNGSQGGALSCDRDPRRGHGLAIAARIASRHGGRLAFSTQPSTARAILELPLAAEPARASTPGAPIEAA